LRQAVQESSPETFKTSLRKPAADWIIPYSRRDLQRFVKAELSAIGRPELQQAARETIDEADLLAERGDNWYDYAYQRTGRTLDSYWRDPHGVDKGEPSAAIYAMHILVGHHGIFSLTPIWILSFAGMAMWLRTRPRSNPRELALLITVLSLVCLAFYLTRGPTYRNYGGVTSGLRWMFWFAPLWLLVMLPAADAMAGRWWTRGVALILLAASVLSAAYPTWNPWISPWIVSYLQYLRDLGWVG